MARVVDLTRGIYRRVYSGIFRNAALNRCSLEAEAWLTRLQLACDDFGNLDGAPQRLYLATIGDRMSHSPAQVAGLVAELAAAGLVRFYQHQGDTYLHLVGYVLEQPGGLNGKRVRRFPASEDDEDRAAHGSSNGQRPPSVDGIGVNPGESKKTLTDPESPGKTPVQPGASRRVLGNPDGTGCDNDNYNNNHNDDDEGITTRGSARGARSVSPLPAPAHVQADASNSSSSFFLLLEAALIPPDDPFVGDPLCTSARLAIALENNAAERPEKLKAIDNLRAWNIAQLKRKDLTLSPRALAARERARKAAAVHVAGPGDEMFDIMQSIRQRKAAEAVAALGDDELAILLSGVLDSEPALRGALGKKDPRTSPYLQLKIHELQQSREASHADRTAG